MTNGIKTGIKIGDTRYLSDFLGVTESFDLYSKEWTKNPSNSKDWEESDVNSLLLTLYCSYTSLNESYDDFDVGDIDIGSGTINSVTVYARAKKQEIGTGLYRWIISQCYIVIDYEEKKEEVPKYVYSYGTGKMVLTKDGKSIYSYK